MIHFTLIALHGNGGGAFRFARTAPYMPTHIQFVALTLRDLLISLLIQG